MTGEPWREVVKRATRNGILYPRGEARLDPSRGCPVVLRLFQPNIGGHYNAHDFPMDVPEARAFHEQLSRVLAEVDLIESTKGIQEETT